MGEMFERLITWMIPPVTHDENVQYWWRVRIAIFGCVSFVGVLMLWAFLLGFIPHFQPPVMASDLKPLQIQIASVQQQAQQNSDAIRSELAADRAERIEGELLQLRIRHCAAKAAAKDLYWGRISTLMVKYQQLTGRVYPLAQCTDL